MSLDDLITATGCKKHKEKYSLDCLVRHIQEHGHPGPLKIVAGMGTLEIDEHGQQVFTPARMPLKRLIADPETQRERLAICSACAWLINGKCAQSGCGCNGLGNVQNALSKCPIGKWSQVVV